MGPPVGRQESAVTALPTRSDDDPHWSAQEIASFAIHPGSGRVLAVRPGGPEETAVEGCLREAGYSMGRLSLTREPSHLPQAAATFGPDVIYVLVDRATGLCLAALEALANDPLTQSIPLVALIPEYASSAVVEEAYSRAGCDFFRLGTTNIELLARTHLLVRLSARARNEEPAAPPIPEAANSPGGARLDLWDPQTQAYSATYLRRRLPSEAARAFRYSRDLSLVTVRCPAASRTDVAAALSHRLHQTCRNVDLVARLQDDLFALLLPETGAEGVATVIGRLNVLLEEMEVEGYVGCATLGEPETPDADSLLRAAVSRAGG